jgi:hypothetical protein
MTIADQLAQALRDACKALDVATTPLARDRQEVIRAKVGALAALAAYDAAPDDDAKDALRYRWLRDKADPDAGDGIYVSQYGLTNSWGKDLHPHLEGQELDAAIDAARSKP